MLVKDYGPSMAVLQALGDMPLGSLEHDGGVGIPAHKFGLIVGGRTAASFGIDCFRYSQETATTNPMHYLVILCSAGKGAPWGMVLVADPVNPS